MDNIENDHSIIKIKPLIISRLGVIVIFLFINIFLDYNINNSLSLGIRIYSPFLYFLLFWIIYISFFISEIEITETELKIKYPFFSFIKTKNYDIENIKNILFKETIRISTVRIYYQSPKKELLKKHYFFGFSNINYDMFMFKLKNHSKINSSIIKRTDAHGKWK